MKCALVTDFDGTITFDDFFDVAVLRYLNDEALDSWRNYLQGKITHFQALKEIFEKIKVSKEEFDNFIKTIKVDQAFYKTVELCQEKNIPIYIVSAGCDYYIKVILGKLLNDLTLITNSATYSKETGLLMQPQPKESPYYHKNIGVNKKAVVQELKNEGYYVVFAGDGGPDLEPAKISDVVFARKTLLRECKKFNIANKTFDTYNDVYNLIKEL